LERQGAASCPVDAQTTTTRPLSLIPGVPKSAFAASREHPIWDGRGAGDSGHVISGHDASLTHRAAARRPLPPRVGCSRLGQTGTDLGNVRDQGEVSRCLTGFPAHPVPAAPPRKGEGTRASFGTRSRIGCAVRADTLPVITGLGPVIPMPCSLPSSWTHLGRLAQEALGSPLPPCGGELERGGAGARPSLASAHTPTPAPPRRQSGVPDLRL